MASDLPSVTEVVREFSGDDVVWELDESNHFDFSFAEDDRVAGLEKFSEAVTAAALKDGLQEKFVLEAMLYGALAAMSPDHVHDDNDAWADFGKWISKYEGTGYVVIEEKVLRAIMRRRRIGNYNRPDP